MEEHERVEANNSYAAGDPEFVKTPGGCFHAEENKVMSNRVMARQETVFNRFKNFQILQKSFHTKAKNLELHGDVFRAVAVIIQIGIEHGDAKLYQCSDYCDSFKKRRYF